MLVRLVTPEHRGQTGRQLRISRITLLQQVTQIHHLFIQRTITTPPAIQTGTVMPLETIHRTYNSIFMRRSTYMTPNMVTIIQPRITMPMARLTIITMQPRITIITDISIIHTTMDHTVGRITGIRTGGTLISK